MANRILIKNAIVLSQDEPSASCRAPTCSSRATRSPTSGPDIAADGAEVIDADGDIVIPGFIDTHRHTWETSIRTSAPDYTLGAYFGAILDKFAPELPAGGRPTRRTCGARSSAPTRASPRSSTGRTS